MWHGITPLPKPFSPFLPPAPAVQVIVCVCVCGFWNLHYAPMVRSHKIWKTSPPPIQRPMYLGMREVCECIGVFSFFLAWNQPLIVWQRFCEPCQTKIAYCLSVRPSVRLNLCQTMLSAQPMTVKPACPVAYYKACQTQRGLALIKKL